jgi:hypothetical protein
LRRDPLDQRGRERLAAAEEGRVLLAERLQAAVGADLRARVTSPLGWAGGLAADGLGQQLEAAVEIGAEVDPGVEAEEAQGRVLGARKDDRDDREGRVLGLAVEGLVLLALLPGTKAVGAEQHGHGAAVGEGILERLGPRAARGEIPAVEEDPEPVGVQGLGDALDHRLVGAAVAQEDVKGSAVHPCPVLVARVPHAGTHATPVLACAEGQAMSF